MSFIDLHTHSYCSDGTYSPANLIKYAKEKNLLAVALTDHDTIEGLNEASVEASNLGIELISGVEIAADFNGREIHILGLFIDKNSEILVKSLTDMKIKRDKRNINLVKLLVKKGIDITYEDLLDKSKGSVITRAHFAKCLVEKGYGKNINEIFKTYLSPGTDTYLMRELYTSSDAISLIHSASGIAVLAHPGEYKLSDKEVDQMANSLKNEGLDALEVIYTTNSTYKESLHRDIAKKYNLQITGGSDFHGKNKPNIDLATGFGNLRVPEEVLTKLKLYSGLT